MRVPDLVSLLLLLARHPKHSGGNGSQSHRHYSCVRSWQRALHPEYSSSCDSPHVFVGPMDCSDLRATSRLHWCRHSVRLVHASVRRGAWKIWAMKWRMTAGIPQIVCVLLLWIRLGRYVWRDASDGRHVIADDGRCIESLNIS